MEIGDRLIFRCDSLSLESVGIGRHDGIVIFVPSLLPGETAEIAVTELHKNFAAAKVLKRTSDAPERVEPDCPYYETCGGCNFRHLSYAAECEAKTQAVRDALRRFRVETTVRNVLSASPERTRNKAMFHFTENGRFGYFAPGTHEVCAIADCLLLPRVFTDVASLVADECAKSGMKPSYLLLRSSTDNKICVALSLPGVRSDDKRLFSIVDKIVSAFPDISGVLLGGADRPEAEKKSFGILYGDACLTDRIGPLRLSSTALSFRQVNFAALEILLREIDSAASPHAGETVADLYCGTGMIGQYLAAIHPGITVTGVEINEHAVDDAEYNAGQNGLSGLTYFCGDAARYVKEAGVVDLAVVDPPRAGLSDAMRRQILELRPGRIVYVSCNPFSMAHDVSVLSETYRAEYVQPVDMFPRTGNTESVVRLIRK